MYRTISTLGSRLSIIKKGSGETAGLSMISCADKIIKFRHFDEFNDMTVDNLEDGIIN
jgi:hypothetical protein